MKTHEMRRGGRGFSLAELLVAVGILAVLLAVAVPSILHYRRELKLTELDDNARAVFMAAQNHLSALRSASVGDLDVSDAVGRSAGDVPSAAVSGLGAETKLKYVSTDVAGAEPDWLVLPGSIEGDLSEGSYLVEFDPASGAVYGVFYMEKSGSRALNAGVYQTIYEYVDGESKSCRVREGRKSFSKSSDGFFVGYYGADGALDITRPDTKKLPTPKLTLINAEELRLDISADSVSDALKSKLRVDVTATDGIHTKTLVEEKAFQVGDVGRVVVDSLNYDPNKQTTSGWKAGKSFREWMEEGGSYVITPGADITLTVSIWYKPDSGEGIAALPTTASVKANSLFAQRSGDTVEVAYGRHLENLDALGLDAGITAAKQVKKIYFGEQSGSGIYSWKDTYQDRTLNAINNEKLDSYYGGGLAILDMNAVADDNDNAGLFGTFSGSKLEKVVLVDAKATGKNAGALAGAVVKKDAVVAGCQVYLDEPDSGKYSETVRIKGTTNAGGLIGWTGGVSAADRPVIQNSFAATVVTGGTVGGLVGRGPVQMTESYAAGHLTGATVGGLVGGGSGVEMENCYAAGTIAKATAVAGGLSAQGVQSAKRSYAAVDYMEGVSGAYGAAASGSVSNVYYLVKSGVNSAGVGTPISSTREMKKSAGLAGLGSAFVEGGSPDGNEGIPAFPYNLPNAVAGRDPVLSAPYPYPALADSEHYGDWLVYEGDALLAYYEKYADGSYGYYYFDPQEPAAAISTLRGDSDGNYGAVVEEGYGVLSSNEPSLTAADGSAVALSQDAAASLAIDGKAYSLFTMDGAWLQGHHGYQEAAVGGQKVFFNPDFAKTISLAEKSTATATDYAVRSVRQLDNIDALDDYSSKSFVQELNLDGATFAGTLYGKTAGEWETFPVQYAAAPFAGMLDGHREKGLMVRNLTITGEQYAGLFGQIGPGATVRNLALASVKVSASSWGDTYAGGLAAVISGGTVSNSGVFVVDVDGATKDAPYDSYPITGNANAGGFAGKITGGTVSTCFAAVKVTAGTSGGFAGSLSGGTLSDCYAAGHTVSGVFEAPAGDKSANITGSSAAAGFVGEWTAGTISGTCYTTLSVDGGWSGRVGAFAAVYPSGTKLPTCYAKSYVYSGGSLVNPADLADLGLDTSTYDGAKGAAHPYDSSLAEEYDFKPIAGLEHYGDWSLKKLRGLVAYYEQIELSAESGAATPNLKTEFFYYDRVQNESTGKYELVEKGNLDKTRTGSLYSDGYAFLSLNQLHKTGEETKPVTLKVDIGGTASLEDMAEHPTTYLGSYNADLTPFVEKYDGTKPFYYAYGLPNAALDVAANAEDYFLQLKVAGLDSEVEQSSLWLNPHFGRTAYNGYGDTNPKEGDPRVPIPDATGDVIPIRSVRQFNNMRKYPSDIKSWTQELEIDASKYKGHVDKDSDNNLTLGGVAVMQKQGDGTWAPVKCSGEPSLSSVPASYRLAMTPIHMVTKSDPKGTFGGTYDGGGHTISNLVIGTHENSGVYAGLIYRLSSAGTLENINLADSAIIGDTGSGNSYTGGLVGYMEGTVFNCTVRGCTIEQKNGSSKSYVGGLVGYVRGDKAQLGLDAAGAPAPCAVINCAVDGGASGYTGGFVGYIRGDKATLQNCGVRVEDATVDGAQKTATALYDTQTVKGEGGIGGFVGGLETGVIQYSHAAVKVSGKVAGGFAGTMTGGTIHNSYAGGHTKGGVYIANNPNVSTTYTTGRAGGFVGEWTAGNITGTCYTTCSVNGLKQELTGAFSKSYPSSGLDLSNCYAAGYVYVNGKRVSSLEGAVGGLGDKGWTGEKAAAQRYDTTLPEQYTYKPTTNAAGALMTHYGDWYEKSARPGREWVQQLDENTTTEYENLGTQMEWEGENLHLKYEVAVTDGSQDIFNTGPNTNGIFCIATDLGYKLIFRATSSPKEIIGGSGAHITFERVLLDKDRNPLPAEYEGDLDYVKYITWDVTVPKSDLPPYMNTVKLGAMEYIDPGAQDKEEAFLAEIPVPDGGVPPFAMDATITVDGNFSDWIGYEHQVLEPLPAGEQTPLFGHTTGSVLGDGNNIYLHVVTTRPENWTELDDNQKSLVEGLWPTGWPATTPSNLFGFPTLGSMYITATGKDGFFWTPDYTFYNSLGCSDREINGSYTIMKTDTTSLSWTQEEAGAIYFYVDDTRIEYEMVLYMDKYVGEENMQNVDTVDFLMGRAWNKHLTVKRDLDSPDP